MTEYYFGSGGSDITGDGIAPATAWESREYAVTQTNNDDTLILLDGDFTAPASPGYWNITTGQTIKSQSWRGGVITADTGQSTYVARKSGSYTSAANPMEINDVVFDGEDRVTYCFEIGSDTTEDIVSILSGGHYKDGANYCLFINDKRGTQLINNPKLSGSPSVAGLGGSASLATNGDQVVNVNGGVLDLSYAGSGLQTGVGISKIDNLTYLLDVVVRGITGKMTCTGTGASAGVDIKGAIAPVVSGCKFTVDSVGAASNSGLIIRGKAIAVMSGMVITGNEIDFFASSGYGIQVGVALSDTYSSGGLVSGNTVKGKFYTSATPHMFMLGQGSNEEMKGNTAIYGYVGFLASKCTDANIQGNLAYDCYGPAYYIKGTTACTVKGNTAVYSGRYDSNETSEQGIAALAVHQQTDGTNTVAATIQENIVYVADISKINALAHKSALQSCSFVRNTYVIPDTVDISAEDLFSYDQAIGATPNNTLAEWNSQTEVTDDRIVQMPVSEINRIISELKPSVLNRGRSRTLSLGITGYGI